MLYCILYTAGILDSITGSVDVLTEERGVAGDYFAQSCDGKGVHHTALKLYSSEIS